jgi:hypothetical protein
MATTCVEGLAVRHPGDAFRSESVFTFVARARQRLSEWLCGLTGHDNFSHYEKDRLSLRCISCGHTSPGWTLTAAPPRRVAEGDPQRHRLTRPIRPMRVA